MYLQEIGVNTRNWVDSAQDRDYWRALVDEALNLRVPYAMEVVKRTGKRLLRRPRWRWEDNIRMDFKEICIHTRNWVDSAQDIDYWSPCECGIEPPSPKCHGGSNPMKASQWPDHIVKISYKGLLKSDSDVSKLRHFFRYISYICKKTRIMKNMVFRLAVCIS